MRSYKAKQSNVSIINSADPVRVSELLTLRFKENVKKVIFDIGIMRFYDENGNSLSLLFDAGKILDMLRSKYQPIHLIIVNMVLPGQAELLTPILSSIALDDLIFESGSHVSVVADATMFPESLLRKCIVVTPPFSTPEERQNLLNSIVQEFQKAGINIDINPAVIDVASGLTLKEIETIALKSIYDKRVIDVHEFTNYKLELLQKLGLEYIEPKITFEHIGGYDSLKTYIRGRFVRLLKNPELAEKYGVTYPRGLILYGLPGTGKTIFSMALASEVGLPMVKLTPDKLFHGIVGESEKAVRRLARILEEMSPIIIFIDEIDQLFIDRSQLLTSTDSGVTTRIISGLLDWLGDKERKAFIIGATNYIDRIDRALMRPGRIDEVIPIFPPDFMARKQIFQIHTSIVRRVPLKGVDEDTVARRTELFTGAEIEKVVIDAAASAMMSDDEYVTEKHIMDAIDSMGVDMTLREENIKKMVEVISSIENVNKSFLRRLRQETSGRVKDLISNL
ncbi:MAG: ATP-binding protein [Nitrososphaerota archaeon]